MRLDLERPPLPREIVPHTANEQDLPELSLVDNLRLGLPIMGAAALLHAALNDDVMLLGRFDQGRMLLGVMGDRLLEI